MRVLVVEDDRKLGRVLERGLGEEGLEVALVGDGKAAVDELANGGHDVCVLDVMLPGLDGFQVIERARARGCATPILLLTARDAVDDRVRGLNLGADDYLVKPFAFAELIARLGALARRAPRTPPRRKLAWGGVELDPGEHRVRVRGRELELSPKQFALLEALLADAPQVVSRQALLQRVWGYTFDPGTNILDVHVAHLRDKLDGAGERDLVETVRGVGFRLAPR